MACLKQIFYFKACNFHFGISCILLLLLLFLRLCYSFILYFVSLHFLSLETALTTEKENMLAIFIRVAPL